MIMAALVLAFTCTAAYGQWTWTPEIGRWINLRRQPKETAALQFQHAERLLTEGDTERAITEYEKVLRYYPDSNYCDLAQYSIGRALEAQADYRGAVEAYQKVIDEYPNTGLFNNVLEKQRRIGDRFFQLGIERQKRFMPTLGASPFERAIDTYRRLIDNQPFGEFSGEAQYKIGLSHFKMELHDEAAVEFQKVLDHYPACEWIGEAAFGAADCKFAQALPAEYDKTAADESMAKFRYFLRNFPDSSRAEDAHKKIDLLREIAAQHEYNVGVHYHRNLRFDSARVYFDSIVREYPETKWAEKANERLGEMP